MLHALRGGETYGLWSVHPVLLFFGSSRWIKRHNYTFFYEISLKTDKMVDEEWNTHMELIKRMCMIIAVIYVNDSALWGTSNDREKRINSAKFIKKVTLNDDFFYCWQIVLTKVKYQARGSYLPFCLPVLREVILLSLQRKPLWTMNFMIVDRLFWQK